MTTTTGAMAPYRPTLSRPPRPAGRRVHRAAWVLVWVAVGVAALSVLLAGLHGPLGYDEAYNLQVPLHLLRDGHYATDGSVYADQVPRDFDVFISTGPTVLVPVWGLLALFGDQLWVARLVPTGCYLALLVLAGLAGRRAGGGPAALVAVLGVLAVNLDTDGVIGLLGSGDVLGEVPATALLTAAVLLLARCPRWAALCIGMAVLTKLLVLLALPAFLVVAFCRGRATTVVARGVVVVEMLLLAALPNLAWLSLQLVVLGPRLWSERLAQFVVFFRSAGSGIVADPAYQVDRFGKLGQMWCAPALTAVVVTVVVLATVVWVASSARPGDRRLPLSADAAVAAGTAGAAALILLTWWFFVAGRPMGRYLVTPLVLLVVAVLPVVVVVLRHRAASLGRRQARALHVALVLLGCGLAGQAAVHAVEAWSPAGPSLADQRVVAHTVRAGGEPLLGAGWFQAPEISYLAGVRSHEVGGVDGVLVLTAPQRQLDPAGYAHARARCADVRLQVHGYLLCDVPAASSSSSTPR